MDWTDYIVEVYRTVPAELTRADLIVNAALGLCGETGEIADAIKKARYQSHDMDMASLRNELGDVLWYWTLLATELGMAPDEIMAANVRKLRARYPDGFSAERSRARSEGEATP